MQLYKIKATDFCCFEEFELPLYKTGLVWVTGENKDSKAANNNGSGKSTIFKAIVWGLYGQSIDNVRGDKVIRDGAKKARVEIILKDRKEKWRIIRERKHGSPSLKIIQPDGEEFKASKKALQDKIIEMVGLDYPAFKNTVLYGQNDVSRFANPRTRDSDRKETLHRILGIGVLKECHEWIRKKRSEIRGKLEEVVSGIKTARALIKEQDIKDLKDHQLDFVDEQEKRINELKEKISTEEEQAKIYRKRLKQFGSTDYDALIRDKKLEIKKLVEEHKRKRNSLQKDGEALERKIEKNRKGFLVCCEQRSMSKAEVDNVKRQLKNLDGEFCPTCRTSLKQGDAKKYVGKLKEELNTCENELSELTCEREERNEEINKLNKKFGKIKDSLIFFDTSDGRIDKLQTECHKLELQKSELSNTKKDLEQKIEQCGKNVSHWEWNIGIIKKEKNPYDDMIKKARAKIKKYRIELEELKLKRKKLTKELAHIEFWVHGFSNKGLPSYLLDRVMVDITDRTNHYLGILSDGDISMEFETQSEMASSKGDLKDEISISWVIEGMEDSYPPSGGQLKKMEIATDLALMDLAQAQEGAGIDLLALDEVLDGLDQEGVQRVLLLLREMRRDRGSIFVISHESDMFEIFEKSVTVTKKDGISSLKVRA